MSILDSTQTTYQFRNVMELLVEQEVERQIQQFPERIAKNLKAVQVITYAMNRLKPLYACTERGFAEQLQKAQEEHGSRIKQIVRLGIQTVWQVPLQQFSPIAGQTQDQDRALESVRSLLNDPNINWERLPQVLETALRKTVDATAVQKPATHQATQQHPELTWQDYKVRRSAEITSAYLNQRSSAGAAGRLRLTS
jgi:hypothetical protein